MNIRILTCLIIRKDRKFLVGRDPFGRMKWSDSPYDAWHTRVRAEAMSIQMKTGGEILLFNPAVGKVKTL